MDVPWHVMRVDPQVLNKLANQHARNGMNHAHAAYTSMNVNRANTAGLLAGSTRHYLTGH